MLMFYCTLHKALRSSLSRSFSLQQQEEGKEEGNVVMNKECLHSYCKECIEQSASTPLLCPICHSLPLLPLFQLSFAPSNILHFVFEKRRESLPITRRVATSSSSSFPSLPFPSLQPPLTTNRNRIQ